MSNNVFPVDINAIDSAVVDDWHDSFSWPVSDEEFQRIWQLIVAAYRQVLQSADSISADVMVINWKIVFEVVHLFHAALVLKRAKSGSSEILTAKNSLWYHDLMNDCYSGGIFRQLDDSALPDYSSSLNSFISEAKMLVRNIGYWFMQGLFSRVPMEGSSCIVGVPTSFQLSYILEQPFYLKIKLQRQWLEGVSEFSPSEEDMYGVNENATKIISLFTEIAQSEGLGLSDDSMISLGNIIKSHMIRSLRQYLFLKNKVKHSFYKHLYAPSLGSVFQRTLAMAMIRNGRKVTTFAHGGCIGLFDSPSFAFTEFALSDTFVAYSKNSASVMRKIQESHDPLVDREADIVFAPKTGYRKHRARLNKPASKKVKKVMIVGYPHTPWRRSSGTADHSLMHLDLEIRLIDSLKSEGYEVLYKAHPDRLKEISGIMDGRVQMVTENFRESNALADAFIFGSVRTTAFPFALCTNKPILMIRLQYEYVTTLPEPYSLLKKRCVEIPAHLDDRHRIMFDNDRLLEGLSSAGGNTNTEYLDTYLL